MNQVSVVGKPVVVFVDGPFSGGCDDNDEFPVWYVWREDENGEDVGKTYTCRSWHTAKQLGRKIAQDQKLILEDGSMMA